MRWCAENAINAKLLRERWLVRKLIMEEKKSRMESLIEWARNNYSRQISLRVARKYLKDDAYFWAALSDARSAHQPKYGNYSG